MSASAAGDTAAAAGGTLSVTVREASPGDMPLLLNMIQDLAAYEGMPEGPKLTANDLIEDGFSSEPPWFFALVAECGGEVAGYAVCNRAYSSWTGRALYIEDLYVRPAVRRKGVGRALLQAVCRRAVSLGVSRVDWHVLQDNVPALAFYRRLGAADICQQERRTAMRLYSHRIHAVALGHFLP